MTRDDMIRMAREAGIFTGGHPMSPWSVYPSDLERFAALVAAHEREMCAGLCGWRTGVRPVDAAIETCAAAIRARGETK